MSSNLDSNNPLNEICTPKNASHVTAAKNHIKEKGSIGSWRLFSTDDQGLIKTDKLLSFENEFHH